MTNGSLVREMANRMRMETVQVNSMYVLTRKKANSRWNIKSATTIAPYVNDRKYCISSISIPNAEAVKVVFE
ncbi:hypothetical protein D3C73_1453380 [compost metagenome]